MSGIPLPKYNLLLSISDSDTVQSFMDLSALALRLGQQADDNDGIVHINDTSLRVTGVRPMKRVT